MDGGGLDFDIDDMIEQDSRQQEDMEQANAEEHLAMLEAAFAQHEEAAQRSEESQWQAHQVEDGDNNPDPSEVHGPATPVPAESSLDRPPVLPAMPSTPPSSNATPTPPSSDAQGQQDSPGSSGSGNKRRICSKSGDGERSRQVVHGVALRDCEAYRAWSGLSAKAKSAARNRVRTVLARRHKLLGKGLHLRLCDGSVLWCRSAEDLERNKPKIQMQLLYDMAMSGFQDRATAGAAADRWFTESGEQPRAVGRPSATEARGVTEQVIKANTVLLCYHGDFGVARIDKEQVKSMSLRQLETYLKQHPAVQHEWKQLLEQVIALKDRYGLVAFALALELCTRAWKDEKTIRLHAHAWLLQHHNRPRLHLSELSLRDCKKPFFSAYGLENRKGISVYAGCFYCIVEKEGQICSYATKAPHVDYQVKPEWVTRLYAGFKISYETAEYHIARQVTNCCSLLKDLARSRDFMMERAESLEREQILKHIQGRERPWRVIPEIVLWLKDFDPENPLDRYLFLVLDGPSQMGKTRFVQSNLVADPTEALILDCADAVIPQLKGNYVRGKHKLVMFDEAHAEMIIRCKKLFQSPVNPVTYGSSPTNAFVHTVWIHGVKLVVGSNVWMKELDKLPKESADWISSNSLYVRVDRPLFV